MHHQMSDVRHSTGRKRTKRERMASLRKRMCDGPSFHFFGSEHEIGMSKLTPEERSALASYIRDMHRNWYASHVEPEAEAIVPLFNTVTNLGEFC